MRKWFLGLFLVIIIAGGSLSIYAAPPRFGPYGSGTGPNKNRGPFHHIREDARHIIHRTAMVLFEARGAAERRHHFSGMALAMGNQQLARKLYFDGFYRDAIFHSLRARKIGIQIIRNNHGWVRYEFFHDEMEEDYVRDMPGDEEMDRRLPGGDLRKDEDTIHFRIHLDID